MRKEKCRQIKTNIFENVAPSHYGKVNLNDAFRLFSHLGSRDDIEKCLDEFVKEKVAIKVEAAQGKIYVFEEIALAFGKKWSDDLAGLREQNKKLENEVSVLQGKIGIMEDIRNLWMDGWEDLIKDQDLCANVSNYVSSVFFAPQIEKGLHELKERNRTLKIVNKKIEELENLSRMSYET